MYKNYYPFFQKKINGKEVLYFDAACTYIKNQDTILGIERYYRDFSCCSGDRESSYLGSQLQNEIEETRKIVKSFIGASVKDIVVFTSSATDGINKVISGIDESIIKTFIVSDLEHNSNFLPQREWAKRKGIEFNIVPYKAILDIQIFEDYLKKIKGPFLLSFTQSSNIIGGLFDIQKISDIVHKCGGFILVDDAQYITYNQENVTLKNIDFCVFSAHKLGGPTGIGILFIKDSAKKLIKYSQQIGGGTVKKISTSEEVIFKEAPFFLEGGVQNFGGILGLKACLEFNKMIGCEQMYSHVLGLSELFYNNIEHKYKDALEIISLKGSSLVSVIPKKINSIDFHQYCNFFCDDYIVAFRTGTMCADNYVNTYLKSQNIMRFSFGIYNTIEDIEIFFNIFDKYLEKSKS